MGLSLLALHSKFQFSREERFFGFGGGRGLAWGGGWSARSPPPPPLLGEHIPGPAP